MVAVLIGTATFVKMRSLPRDTAWRIAAGRYGHDHANAVAADAMRDELGLDGPAAGGAGRCSSYRPASRPCCGSWWRWSRS